MTQDHPKPAPSDASVPPETGWSDAELLATVRAYRDLFDRVQAGLPVNKAASYRELSARFGRTPGAYERRMQNISAVLDELAAPWLPGLLPMRNIGTHVRPRLVSLVRMGFADSVHATPAYEPDVLELLSQSQLTPPPGTARPKFTTREVREVVRDATVKAWVLQQAKGHCECCRQPAPFRTIEGLPYLEVHHVKTLANGGADLIENTVALCPNCHRRLHYGEDASELRKGLYAAIKRLRHAI